MSFARKSLYNWIKNQDGLNGKPNIASFASPFFNKEEHEAARHAIIYSNKVSHSSKDADVRQLAADEIVL